MLFLSHWTALEYWRDIRAMGSEVTEAALGLGRCFPVEGLAVSVSKAEVERIAQEHSLALPLEVLIGEERQRRSNGLLKQHRWKPRKSGDCFIEFEPGLHVSSPELLFLQMSSILDFFDLLLLACELTSAYAYDSSGRLIDSVPLATASGLAAAHEDHGAVGNRSKAEAAIRHICTDAKSPKELELALKQTLPFRWGGLGVSGSVLNPELEIGLEAQKISGRNTLRPDFYLPDLKLDIEYDSAEHHSTDADKLDDKIRRIALGREGIEVRPIAQDELADVDEMTLIAKEIFKRRGKRFRQKTPDFKARQQALFERLAQSVEVGRNA